MAWPDPDLFAWGGGERRRGDTGHRELSLGSGMLGFWGVEVGPVLSGFFWVNIGVPDAERLRADAAKLGICDLDLVGLGSFGLFVLEREPLSLVVEVDFLGFRTGDASLEASGDVATEFAAEIGLDDECATPFARVVVEGAEVGGSLGMDF